MTKSERINLLNKTREKGLNEIFSFYCKQHVLKGRKMTFDDMASKNGTMNLAEYLKFC